MISRVGSSNTQVQSPFHAEYPVSLRDFDMAFWPLPRECHHGNVVFWLSTSLQLSIVKKESSNPWYHGLDSSQGVSSEPLDQPDNLIQKAFERMKARVFEENFVPYKFHPRRAKFEPPPLDEYPTISELVIREDDRVPASISREAYSIEITVDGKATIDVVSPIGAVRAFDTFTQAFYAHSAPNTTVYTTYAPLTIRDAPHFEHRGLNLDISRNSISPQAVKRTIQGMGFNKMNRLHLHATDSQSWPLEIPSLPALAQESCYHEDQIWSAKDLEDVQRYGLYHGVEVYLEIDMPGHAGAIFHSYPDLVTAYNKRPWTKYAKEPPSGQLRLNSPDVESFLEKLFDDLLPRTSKFSSRFHLGGDEVNLEAYELDPTVRSSSKEVIKPHLQKFFDHVIGLLTAQNLTPHLWQEILLKWDLKLPPSTVIQVSVLQSPRAFLYQWDSSCIFDPHFGT